MKKFDFKLDQVRGWTETRLRMEDVTLEALVHELRRLDEEFAHQSAQCADFGRQVHQQEFIDSVSLATLSEFRRFLIRERARVDRTRPALEARIENQRQLITEIKRKIALFDKLKDTQYRTWRLEADREMQELADESFAARSTRER